MKLPRFWHFGLVLSIVLPSTLLITSCLRIEHVSQPTYARVGEIISTTVVAYPDYSFGSSNPYFGIHLPDGWSVNEPISYTGSYTGSIIYAANLSAEMENISSKPNYYWWVGMGDEQVASTSGQTATSTLSLQTNDRAGFYYLDYMTGDSTDGINYDHLENIPITVTAAYGAGWQPIPPTRYVASEVTSISIPATLVDLGEMGTDTFDLSIIPPTHWLGTVHTTVPITNTGPMILNQSLPLTVQLTIPTNAALGSYTIPITATSTTDPNSTATTLINITLLSDKRGYALTRNNSVQSIDPVTNEIVGSLSYQPYAESLAIHPQGRYLYATFPDNVSFFPENAFVVLDTTAQKLITFRTIGTKPGKVIFTCDGRKALIADRFAKDIHFFNTTIPDFPLYLKTIENLPGILLEVAAGCGTNLALITSENSDSITVIDTTLMTVMGNISGFHHPTGIVMAPGGQRAYVANEDGTIGVVDVPKRSLLTTWNFNSDSVAELALSPDGGILYLGVDGQFSLINTTNGEVTTSIDLLEGYTDVRDIEASPDCKRIFVAHNHPTYSPSKSVISVVDATTNQLIKTMSFNQDKLRDLVLYPLICSSQPLYLPLVQKK